MDEEIVAVQERDEAVLSEREMEIMRLVATGATNRQIARELIISVNTVKVHLRNIFDKLGVQSRTEAALYTIRQGWIVVEGPSAVAEGEKPAEEVVGWEPVPPTPLSWGKRLYFAAATVLIFAAIFLPRRVTGGSAGDAATNPVIDRGVAPASVAAGSRLAVSRWTGMARLPTPRARLAMVASAGRLYAIGGDGPEGVSGAVEVYDPQTDRWSAGSDKPTPAANIAAVALDGQIYVPGGYLSDGEVTAAVEVYDVERDEWREATSLPEPLCAYAIAAVDGMLYLFGGWDGEEYKDAVYAYDPATEEWSAREPLPGARAFASAGVVDGKVYVIGGYDGQSELATNDEYDPAGDSWLPRSPMTQGRAGVSVAALGSSLYVIGGGWHSYLAANERYDPHTDTWAGIETPIVAQWRNLGTAAIDKDIYAVGGWSEGYLDANEKYQAIYTIFLRLQPIGGFTPGESPR